MQDTTSLSVYKQSGDTLNFLGNHMINDFQQLHTVENTTSNWIFLLIVFMFALLAIGIFFHKWKLKQIISSAVIQRHSNQLVRDSNPLYERISMVLFTIYIFSFPLFLYYILGYFTDIHHLFSGIYIYAALIAFVMLTFIIKTFAIRFTGVVFYTPKQAYLHMVSNFLINISSGLLYLIIIILMIYSEPFLMMMAGLMVLCISFFFKVFKGFQIGYNFPKFSKFHLFLYLCTLEILPVVILVKFCFAFLR